MSVDHSSGRRSAEFGLLVTNIQANSAAAIGYPASVTSRATISNSTFEDMDFAVVVNETVGPSLVDLRVRDNNFILEGPSQIGVVGLTVDDARIADNDFSGVGFAGVVALTSAHWRIRNNDFCDLFIPPSPQNPAQAPVVTANSDDIKLTDNACA